MIAHPLSMVSDVDSGQAWTIAPIIRSTPLSQNISSIALSISRNKVQKMSIHQTYVLAHQARNKLTIEASRPAHNLRLLVGHANMLDSLMLDLADAEKEQERWLHQTVSRADESSKEASGKRSIQWVDTIIPEEEAEQDTTMDSPFDTTTDSDSDISDGDSDYDEECDDEIMSIGYASPARRATTPPAEITITTAEVDIEQDSDEDVEEELEDEDSGDGALALVRVRSHSHSPPELLHEDFDTSESEDEGMPPSPGQAKFPLAEKLGRGKTAVPPPIISSIDDRRGFFGENLYLPRRAQAGISAF